MLSTEPYKGVRDFYPEDKRILNYLMSTMRGILHGYGYEEYDASPLEPAELYESKGNEEIVREQTYTFIDRGERRVTLRPEMTPTVARLVAGRKRELAFPIRWFSIPNVFRYERPQRGRLREHYQLNADIFGVESVEADIEIISIANDILLAFGATAKDFHIRVNSRELLNAAIMESGLSETHAKAYLELLDKRQKIPVAEFEQQRKELLGSAEDPLQIIEELRGDRVKRAKEKLDHILEALHARTILHAEYDPSLTRGFEYYTGMVFEVFDANPENKRSLFGGGRYDNLTSLFGGDPVTGVGFGMGDVTLQDFLLTHELLPKLRTETHLYLGVVSPSELPHARWLAEVLRKQGLNVAIHTTDKKVGDQVRIADKKGIPFFLAIGEDETKTHSYLVKNLATGDETKLKDTEVAPYIKDTLSVSL